MLWNTGTCPFCHRLFTDFFTFLVTGRPPALLRRYAGGIHPLGDLIHISAFSKTFKIELTERKQYLLLGLQRESEGLSRLLRHSSAAYRRPCARSPPHRLEFAHWRQRLPNCDCLGYTRIRAGLRYRRSLLSRRTLNLLLLTGAPPLATAAAFATPACVSRRHAPLVQARLRPRAQCRPPTHRHQALLT